MENENTEEWRQHPLGIFVSSKGRIITKRNGVNYGHSNLGGYKVVKWQGKNYSVHRLVAECFLDNPNNLPTVDHIDRNRSNNCVENLRWADHSTQMLNREVDYKTKVAHTDYKAFQAKRVAHTDYKAFQAKRVEKKSIPVQQYTRQGEFIKEWQSATIAARELGYHQSHINSCCKGKLKSSNGFVWKYKDIS